MTTTADIPVVTDLPQNDGASQSAGSPGASPGALKRKASLERSAEDDDGTLKRPRRDSNPQVTDATSTRQRSKAPSAQEEKKRNKRLFGGLLNTLSQSSTSNPAQKRRLEIERRQQERLQKQREEDERVRKEKGDRRREERARNGIIWEEEVMKNRHTRMLASARFLKTKVQPAVYYLPSKRSAEQDEKIEEQIRWTKKLVEREEGEFEERRRKHEEVHGRPKIYDKPSARRNGADDEDMKDAKKLASPLEKTSAASAEPGAKEDKDMNPVSEGHASSALKPAIKEAVHGDHDESGDEVVDAEEDMVIY